MPTTVGYGVSDTLRSIFEGLSQAEGHFGAKYRDVDINKVKQYVCCRNYSKASLELVYLCWAIVNAYPSRRGATSLETFFWLDEAYTPARLRAGFKQNWQGKAGQVAINNDLLSLTVGHKCFTISPTRVGVLAVLMEFIITVDPSLLNTIQSNVVNASSKDIEQIAKQLQQAIYHFLKSHSPEAQIQTRFRYFENWLKRHNLAVNNLDDDAIMQFWQDASEDSQAQSYVLYATALFDVLDAISAMQVVTSQQAVTYAASFGSDPEHEIDPERLVATTLDEQNGENYRQVVHQLAFGDSNNLDIKSLCQTPKCLTQEELIWLQPLVDYALYTEPFLLSFMRLQVFAKWQSVLVQAKRKSATSLREKLADVPIQGYAMYQLEISGIERTLTYAHDCLLYVLLETEPELACAELLQTLPTEQMQAMAAWLSQQQSPTSTWPSLIKQLALKFSDFQHVLKQLESAFKKNNKAGFKSVAEVGDSEPYVEALQQIDTLQRLIHSHNTALDKFIIQQSSLSSIYRSDVCIFIKRFNTLYGGVHAN